MQPVTFTRKSIVSGIVREKTFMVDPIKYASWQYDGMLVQDAFPHLSADDREFIISGISDTEWDEMFEKDI